jgi:hypothetical protein
MHVDESSVTLQMKHLAKNVGMLEVYHLGRVAMPAARFMVACPSEGKALLHALQVHPPLECCNLGFSALDTCATLSLVLFSMCLWMGRIRPWTCAAPAAVAIYRPWALPTMKQYTRCKQDHARAGVWLEQLTVS